MSNNNTFQPQEWVGYQPTPMEEQYIIFAQISHPVRLKDASGQPLKPMHIEYVIFTSEDDKDGKTVRAIDLYKFIRGSRALDTQPQCEINLQQVKEEIRNELQDIWQISKDDRRRAIHRLYLKWHPDKNLDNPQIAEEVFKFIQDEFDGLERGDGVSSSSSSGDSWHTYKSAWHQTAILHRKCSQQYHESTSHATSKSGADSDSEQRSSTANPSSRSESHGGFFDGNFSPPINEHEARQWVRQAVVDCKALEALLTNAQRDDELSSHVCFMAHQVAEKALKGGMYATCGLGENSLKSHNISPLAHAMEAVRPVKACGLAALTSPLEPYYFDTRSPNQCHVRSISLPDAEAAAECARGVLKMVGDIF